MHRDGPVLRIFEVRVKPGCKPELLQRFETESANVVRNEPGNQGYFFGDLVQGGEDIVMFVSLWRDMQAVKSRFGEDWQTSYLPDGYENLIEECTIRHLDVSSGWHVTSSAQDV